jgi:uncharacterized protein (TIGR02265 family)
MSLFQPDWCVMEASVEALFVRAFGSRIARHRACLTELQALGLDPSQKLKPKYTAELYEDAMAVVRKHLFADVLEDERAYWTIGRQTSEGFYRTMLGTAIGAVMKLLTPERMLPRLPGNITGSTNFMRSTIERRGPRDFELYVFGSTRPAFIGGAVERGVEQTGTKVKVEMVRAAGVEIWLKITW